MTADRRSTTSTPRGRRGAPRRRRWLLLTTCGVAALAVLAAGAFAVFGGFDRQTSERVSGSETQVVRIALVDAVVGFDVTPDVLEVSRGTHVVLDVVNDGNEDHDLAVEGGAKTRTLGPGESQRLDLGAVAGGLAAWCTLPNHKAAGMSLDIRVVAPSATEPSEDEAT